MTGRSTRRSSQRRLRTRACSRSRARPFDPDLGEPSTVEPDLGEPGHVKPGGIAVFDKAITRVHDESGVEIYALHEGADRPVMIEKYGSEEARAEHAEHAERPALAELLSALRMLMLSWCPPQIRHLRSAGCALIR
jgi:hypothetical protein